MTNSGKLTEVLTRLIEKTRKKEIIWDESSFEKDTYTVSFPNHSVKIGPVPIGGTLRITFYNETGKQFAQEEVSEFGLSQIGLPQRDTLLKRQILELYELAQASTSKSNEFERLLEELA